MAKGPGSVGRKPKEPPTYGPPIVFGPTGGGPSVTVKGKGKSKPRKDMKWYEGDQRTVKVSERIYHTDSGDNVETYKTATENIDKVHAVKASQNPMQISAEYAPGSGTLGYHRPASTVDTEPGPNQGKVREYSHIVLNKGYNANDEPAKRATLYHEIGHGQDRQANYEEKIIPNTYRNDSAYKRNYDSENAWEKVARGKTLIKEPGDTPTVQWAKSIQGSKSYKALVVKREKAKKDGTNKDLINYMNYLTDPKELYARSYAQHITKRADPEAEKHWRDNYKLRDADHKKFVGYDQWRGKDFDTIDQSFTRIYGSRGMDVLNIRHDPRVPIEV